MTHLHNRPGLVIGRAAREDKPDTRVRLRVIDNHASVTYAWQNRGACRDADARLFFANDGESIAQRILREDTAKAICGTCPVRLQCREHAITFPEIGGSWGGMTEQELAGERSRRKRAARAAA